MSQANEPIEETQEKKCVTRIPNTHIHYLCDTCYIACNKPYDPAKPDNRDMALCLCPCALVLDILCCIPMTFGCYNIEIPTK
jgi:hypothetical protein